MQVNIQLIEKENIKWSRVENKFCFYRIFLLVDVQGYGAVAKQATGLNERSEVREAAEGYRAA